jgi:hypothetical protein
MGVVTNAKNISPNNFGLVACEDIVLYFKAFCNDSECCHHTPVAIDVRILISPPAQINGIL